MAQKVPLCRRPYGSSVDHAFLSSAAEAIMAVAGRYRLARSLCGSGSEGSDLRSLSHRLWPPYPNPNQWWQPLPSR